MSGRQTLAIPYESTAGEKHPGPVRETSIYVAAVCSAREGRDGDGNAILFVAWGPPSR